MLRIDVPTLPASCSVGRAYKAMKTSSRSGVFIKVNGKLRLLHLDDIAKAQKTGVAKLNDVACYKPVIQLAKPYPGASNDFLAGYMDGKRGTFIWIEMQDGRAHVLSRHEHLGHSYLLSPDLACCSAPHCSPRRGRTSCWCGRPFKN